MNLQRPHLPEHWPTNLTFTLLVLVMVVMAIAWIIYIIGGLPGEMNMMYPILFALAALAVMIEVLPPFFKRE